MVMQDLTGWLDEITSGDYLWFAKRLSGNDTLANGAHQAGPYLPKSLLLKLLPEWHGSTALNPTAEVALSIDSHGMDRTIRATWYNNKRVGGGTRDETRLTGFGGRTSPVLNPDSTGALAFFAFRREANSQPIRCRLWLARSVDEESRLESVLGSVEPGQLVVRTDSLVQPDADSADPCWLPAAEIPPEWFKKFPSGLELVQVAFERAPGTGLDADARLLKRRLCEEQAFYSVEQAVELKEIVAGFSDIESFMTKAKSMTQRRLSRSGRSLELHARQIFEEEGLTAGKGYSWQPRTEMGKKPDFIFPSIDAYNDPEHPPEKLRMLAVKTTCRDRWRQVINEADRVPRKHLLTLQEGVSVGQFEEMESEAVTLVIPRANRSKFKKSLRDQLVTLEQFVDEVRGLNA